MILKGKYSGYHTLLNFRQLLVMGHLVHLYEKIIF